LNPAARFSTVSLVADVLGALVAALDRTGNERGLSADEIRQLETLEALHREALAIRPYAFEMFVVGPPTVRFREALRRARDATHPPISIVELLGMQGAVPSGWRLRLPLSLDGLLWLAVTRLTDDLSLSCAVGVSSPERQEQLEASRRLHAALGGAVKHALQQTPPPEQEVARATARVKAAFASASEIIGAELAAIRAEAAAIRARRQ
jgi:hypothetical protein